MNCIKFSLWSQQQEQGIVRKVVGMKYYSWIVIVLYQIPSLVPPARAGHCHASGGHEILLKDCTVLYQIPSLVPTERSVHCQGSGGMKYHSWIIRLLYQSSSLVPTAREWHCQGSGGHDILLKDCT